MNLNYFEARKHIQSGPLFSAYLFYGEEAYLREELERQLSATFLGADLQFGREKVDGKALTLSQAVERISESNLFASRRLLVVDRPPYLALPRSGAKSTDKADKEEEAEETFREDDACLKRLERFMEKTSLPPQNIIVFLSPAADRRKKIFKLLSAKGLAADCASLKKDDLERWIRERVARTGKTIGHAAMEQLLITGDRELWSLDKELDKYLTYLYEEQREITAEVVELLSAGDAQGNVFKLADALSEGNLARSLHLLQLLLIRREKPLQIFFMLVRHFRLLFVAWDYRQEKISAEHFARDMKLQPFAARKLYQQVAAYDLITLEQIMLALQKIDHRIKTGALDPQGALEIALEQIHHLYAQHPRRI
ncbi:MAG: DNA polymerase III subunit delta [Dethiobacter sp.]|jgi:DNA polymerase-3 subunit delta|nr:DNA polymerase III subunit delta [Dethiobacter sp.]